MDRAKLKELLQPFQALCADKGKPLSGICIEDAFPGDISTSFIIQVKETWVDGMGCSDAIDFLFDLLWETTTEDIRKKVFSIQVLDSKDEPHCWQEVAIAQSAAK